MPLEYDPRLLTQDQLFALTLGKGVRIEIRTTGEDDQRGQGHQLLCLVCTAPGCDVALAVFGGQFDRSTAAGITLEDLAVAVLRHWVVVHEEVLSGLRHHR